MENLRVISGTFKGRSIKSPHSTLAHPMGSREKLALFNMINDKLPGARVLDAFAGSGALGIEALSRSADSVVFLEKSPKIARVIKDNLQNLGINSAKVLIGDATKFYTTAKFDLILADPPYDNFNPDAIIHLTEFLKNGGTLVLSHPDLTPEIPGLNLTTTKKYAKAHLSIYQK